MSTQMKKIDSDNQSPEVHTTRFFGGEENGTMIQLTQFNRRTGNFDNVKVTKAQAIETIERLAQFVGGL